MCPGDNLEEEQSERIRFTVWVLQLILHTFIVVSKNLVENSQCTLLYVQPFRLVMGNLVVFPEIIWFSS